MTLPRLFVPAKTPEDWKRLLARPERQWEVGFSAEALARSWLGARGFPAEVRGVLARSEISALRDLELLIGLPEHRVALVPKASRASQNDLWALARGQQGLVSVAVEGKVKESFSRRVEAWSWDGSPGKRERLEALCGVLGVEVAEVKSLRYQLLHRTASALLEAKRFRCPHALLLVHSFSARSLAPGFPWTPDWGA